MTLSHRILAIYSAFLTAALAVVLFTAAHREKPADFDEITVHRINVVEPNGTLRMVISNHDRLPGIVVRGTEQKFDRPQAGMLFYNDEGSENGGLIFGGHKNSKGEVVDSGGSLSFDKYDANQIVQLAGVNDKEDRFSGLIVSDSSVGGNSPRRAWIGTGDDGAASLALMVASGRKRAAIQVTAEGAAKLLFYDAQGKVLQEIRPPE
jgi:hypothetical protein